MAAKYEWKNETNEEDKKRQVKKCAKATIDVIQTGLLVKPKILS